MLGNEVLNLLSELKTCRSSTDLERLRRIHAGAAKSGYDSLCHVANTLVSMYAKCGSIVDARKLFDRMGIQRTVVSWNALIYGYAENGEEEQALELFATMTPQGFVPNDRTIVAALKACTGLALKELGEQQSGGSKILKTRSLRKGMALHCRASIDGLDYNVFVESSLVDLYAKCGSMINARRVFENMEHHNVVSWNALLFGYVDNGEEEKTLKLFQWMLRERSCVPNALTFVSAIRACTLLAEKEQGIVKTRSKTIGMEIHAAAAKKGYDSDIYVASTLVNMYAKCGFMFHAQQVFDNMKHRNVVSWTSLILGHLENGEAKLALEFLTRMELEGYVLDAALYLAALKACGMTVSLQLGKQVHSQICSQGLDVEENVVCCLIDFYCKCGSVVEAQYVFDSYNNKNLVGWTSLMSGYSLHGDTHKVFDLFQNMTNQCIEPDGITFLTILTACNHAGLVDKGNYYFDMMSSKYGISPQIEHYLCMVDMLGRANQLENALTMVQNMPFKPDAVTWRTLLYAAHKWKNDEVAKLAFDSLVKLGDATAYVLMANIYRNTCL